MSIRFWIWSHLSFILLVAWILCPLCLRRCGVATRMLCGLAIFGLAVLPLQHLDLSGHVLGRIGVLSAPTIILLLQSLTLQLGHAKRLSTTEDRTLNGMWFLAGVAVYTSTFGFVDLDIYSLGYGVKMPWIVLATSGIAALSRYWLAAVCLVTAVLAHQWRLCESPNLWDCLIDPWLFFASMFQLLSTVLRRKPSHKRTGNLMQPTEFLSAVSQRPERHRKLERCGPLGQIGRGEVTFVKHYTECLPGQILSPSTASPGPILSRKRLQPGPRLLGEGGDVSRLVT